MTLVHDTSGAVSPDDWSSGLIGPAQMEVVTGIAPLGLQHGVHPARTVPAALEPLLRSAPAFALLDAARIDGLPERLEASGLRHDCLFKGAARAEWGAVAPWLAALDLDSAFARALFTEADPPPAWQMWPQFSGAVLLTQAPFEALLAALRRFTRLARPDGGWYYFRFWERHVLSALAAADDPLADALLAEVSGQPLTWLVPDPPHKQGLVVRRAPHRAGQPAAAPRLLDTTLAALDAATERRLVRAEIAAALVDQPADVAARFVRDPWMVDLRSRLISAGMAQPEHRRDAMALYVAAARVHRHEEVWPVLATPGAGPEIRIWRVRRMLEAGAAA